MCATIAILGMLSRYKPFETKPVKHLLITLLMFAGLLAMAQENHVYIAGTKFPCTQSLALISPTDTNNTYGQILSVAFAKDNNRGLIILRKQAKGADKLRPSINGTIYIHLDSGGEIALPDNGLHDFKDEVILAAYYITEEDMVKLKNSNIRWIKYTETSYSGTSIQMVAVNRTYIVEDVSGYEMTVERYNIPELINGFW